MVRESGGRSFPGMAGMSCRQLSLEGENAAIDERRGKGFHGKEVSVFSSVSPETEQEMEDEEGEGEKGHAYA